MTERQRIPYAGKPPTPGRPPVEHPSKATLRWRHHQRMKKLLAKKP